MRLYFGKCMRDGRYNAVAVTSTVQYILILGVIFLLLAILANKLCEDNFSSVINYELLLYGFIFNQPKHTCGL